MTVTAGAREQSFFLMKQPRNADLSKVRSNWMWNIFLEQGACDFYFQFIYPSFVSFFVIVLSNAHLTGVCFKIYFVSGLLYFWLFRNVRSSRWHSKSGRASTTTVNFARARFSRFSSKQDFF